MRLPARAARRSGTPRLGSALERTFETQMLQARVGVDYVREYRFHPAIGWRFDFAWPARMIAVEIDGGTWTNGRHSRGAGYAEDCRKFNAAVSRGWRVLRFTSDMVQTGEGIRSLEDVFAGMEL